jgi:glutathione S-transferase
MTMYRLHCFKESGNSYKVALALAIAGVPWDKVLVNYFDGQTRRPTWRADTNEMGEVPVLEVEGGRMSQSGVILLYFGRTVRALAGERQ